MNGSFREIDTKTSTLVRISGLTKKYVEGDLERLVLDGVDAAFEAGEFAVVMGRSGSGKSTLLNLISGIDLPDSGSIYWRDLPSGSYSPSGDRVHDVPSVRSVGSSSLTALSERDRTLFRRHRIGFVFQSFNLIPTLTALENLLLPMELRGLSNTRRARALLERVGLEHRADSFPDRLSGGERQRIAIARALAHEPVLILADEPTGNLDFETGEQVMDVLEQMVREEGKTMIIATHDRDLIGRADRLWRLEGGRLVEA